MQHDPYRFWRRDHGVVPQLIILLNKESLLSVSPHCEYLEIVKPNQASRDHLQVIRQAYADNGIESVA